MLVQCVEETRVVKSARTLSIARRRRQLREKFQDHRVKKIGEEDGAVDLAQQSGSGNGAGKQPQTPPLANGFVSAILFILSILVIPGKKLEKAPMRWYT